MFYDPYYISKGAIYIIIPDFVNSVSYGTIWRSKHIGKNTYTGPRIGKRYNVTPIWVPILKKEDNYH